jgi:hypothetical protein
MKFETIRNMKSYEKSQLQGEERYKNGKFC